MLNSCYRMLPEDCSIPRNRSLWDSLAPAGHRFPITFETCQFPNICMILKNFVSVNQHEHGQSYIYCTHKVPALSQTRKCSLKLYIISKSLARANANSYVRSYKPTS